VLFADIWQDEGGTGTITSATYNGTSLTKATSTRAGGMASEIWYLVNPATGSNTMSVTVTGATDSIKLTAASFTGALQSSPLDASNAATGFGGNPTMSLTTGTANDLVAATLSRFGTTAATTNRTALYNSTASSTLGAASYQIATTTGSYSDTYTGSASADWSMAMAGFKPATGGGTGSTTMYMIHTDHLTGSNVLTDASGNIAEVTDYYPYGSERIATGTFDEQRKFAGTEYDTGTGLNYMGARYYNPACGQFISEDPSFLGMGASQITAQLLADPQQQNSYSYARNNPLRYTDPTGEEAKENTYAALSGALQGLKDTLTSLLATLSNPVGTVQNTASAVAHPVSTARAVYSNAKNTTSAYMNASEAERWEMAGYGGIFFAGSLLIDKGVGKSLPDSTLVCRGGACKADEFRKGVGVTQGADGKLSGVSVLVGINGESKAELLSKLPARFQGKGEFTTLGEMRTTTSATLVQTGKNPLHHEMGNLTPEEFEKLFHN
jgi:RHS repeat-associated protein